MTDEQRVKEVYPDFTATYCAHVWEIWESESTEGNYSHRLGHSAQSLALAFSDAASRLQKGEDDPLCQLSSCGHPLSMHNDNEGCCTAPSDFSQKDYGGEIGVQPTRCPCSRFRSIPEVAPQTFEECWAETGKLWNLVHDERLRLAAKDTARRTWDAAKASSPAVAGGESERQKEER